MPIIDKSQQERRAQERAMDSQDYASSFVAALNQGNENLKRVERENRAVKRMEDKQSIMDAFRAAAQQASERVSSRDRQFLGTVQLGGDKTTVNDGQAGYLKSNSIKEFQKKADTKEDERIKRTVSLIRGYMGQGTDSAKSFMDKDVQETQAGEGDSASTPNSSSLSAVAASPSSLGGGSQSSSNAQVSQNDNKVKGNKNIILNNTSNNGVAPSLRASQGQAVEVESEIQDNGSSISERSVTAQDDRKRFDSINDLLKSEQGIAYLDKIYDEQVNNELYGQDLNSGMAQGLLKAIEASYTASNAQSVHDKGMIDAKGATLQDGGGKQRASYKINDSANAASAGNGKNDPSEGMVEYAGLSNQSFLLDKYRRKVLRGSTIDFEDFYKQSALESPIVQKYASDLQSRMYKHFGPNFWKNNGSVFVLPDNTVLTNAQREILDQMNLFVRAEGHANAAGSVRSSVEKKEKASEQNINNASHQTKKQRGA